MILYISTSLISLFIGIFFAYLLKPGIGVQLLQQKVEVKEGMSLSEWLLSIIPVNPFEAMSSGHMIQIIITSLLLGLGITLAKEKGKPFLSFFESANEVINHILGIILKLAPIGVFSLMVSVIANQGLGILKNLSLYIIGLILSIFVMGFGIYGVLLFLLGTNPLKFYRSFFPAITLAFGTASSNATLPLAMENAEKRYGMKKEIFSFAIPFGISLKKDGAAILQGFTALFVAQLSGIDL
ncbi:sodium:dicarboxylate symporter family protein [Tepidibacillus fermentans]|uniref:Sodium:dicarboxylate symporter family protein n=1 Tax=Tepidibacillus fermentans TaxID=1281767 RepID=A0A4R3KI91_9BACI|nr:sodium:dicarboxylate symporter family protein [Tepidibacillus fermentans]